MTASESGAFTRTAMEPVRTLGSDTGVPNGGVPSLAHGAGPQTERPWKAPRWAGVRPPPWAALGRAVQTAFDSWLNT